MEDEENDLPRFVHSFNLMVIQSKKKKDKWTIQTCLVGILCFACIE